MEKSDNEIIAEFMGLEVCDGWNNEDGTPTAYWRNNLTAWEPPVLVGGGILPIRMMKFDTSWDWLMPVVEKIGTMSIGFHVNINSFDGCHIYDDQHRINGQGKSIRSGINGNLIQVTYKAVVEFIKWHNQQKKEL